VVDQSAGERETSTALQKRITRLVPRTVKVAQCSCVRGEGVDAIARLEW
jgi:hypothetical protein